MNRQFMRTEMMIGENGVKRLQDAAVIVFGIGGVGSYVAEGLARAGVGTMTLVDKDVIDLTNLNRQIPALHSTVGQPKAQVMAQRIKDINPACQVNAVECFFLPENADRFDFRKYDYVVDAIDTVSGKIAIIEKAYRQGVSVIASMGTGNKLDPTAFQVSQIEKTKVCPLAKVMRKELKKRGIKGIKVLYSEEAPVEPNFGLKQNPCHPSDLKEHAETFQKATPGSISFVPSVAGLIIAGEVVRDLLKHSANC